MKKLLLLISIFTTSLIGFSGSPSDKLDIIESNYHSIQNIYSKIGWNNHKLNYSVFEKAILGYQTLKNEQKIDAQNATITIIDYSLPSTEKRLWVIDLATYQVLYNTLVSHGKNTGNNYSTSFSNVPESHKSSLGFFVTGQTYQGKHGLSLYLDGVEKGVNDNARSRYIVMHGANYVNQNFINQHGRLGRSLGCPAVPEALSAAIINAIANKTCMFSYYPSKSYVASSQYLSAANF